MNLVSMLFHQEGIISCSQRKNVFRPVESGPGPFLLETKPVPSERVIPAFDAGVATRSGASQAVREGKAETMVLKLVGALFAIVVLTTGFGAQHIAYTRSKNRLGRELRQKEHELRMATQAYRALESRKALEVAQGFRLPAPQVAKESAPQRAATPGEVRAGTAIVGKPGPVSTATRGPHGERPHQAGVKSRPRGAGTRG